MTAEQQHDTTAELNEALAGAFETGNCDGLVPFYTEGATLIPPRGSLTVGRAGIGAFWLGVRNRFAAVTFTTSDLQSLGEIVRRETGTYVMLPNDVEAASPEGKYLFVWTLVEGEWQIESGIWNRNADSGGGRGAALAGGQGVRAQDGGRRQAGAPGSGGGQGGGARQGGGGQGGGGQGGPGRQGGGRMGGGQGGGYPGQGRRPGGGRMGGGAGVGGGRQNQGGGPGQDGRRDARSLYDQSPGLYSNLDD